MGRARLFLAVFFAACTTAPPPQAAYGKPAIVVATRSPAPGAVQPAQTGQQGAPFHYPETQEQFDALSYGARLDLARVMLRELAAGRLERAEGFGPALHLLKSIAPDALES